MPFPVDIKFIAETEHELGVEFPKSFKQKMMIENGGEMSKGRQGSDWQQIRCRQGRPPKLATVVVIAVTVPA